MYDPILSRSFSKYEQKRLGNCAFLVCLIVALSLCTVFRPQFHQSVLNLRLSTGASLDMLVVRDASVISQQLAVSQITLPPQARLQQEPPASSGLITDKEAEEMPTVSKSLATSQLPLPSQTTKWQEPIAVVRPTEEIEPKISQMIATTSLPDHPPQTPQRQEPLVPGRPIETQTMDMKPICRVSEPLSDYCDIKGNIKILGNASTIFVASSPKIVSAGNSSWRIKPYARKGNEDAMNYVREWSVKAVEEEARENIPSCTKYHTTPAILFSAGGYSGNHFHGFSDVLIPLFSNSRIFKGKVHFLATNYKRWWISKFRRIFDKLSDHEVIDIDREEGIHCYQRVIVGLKSHKELGIDKSKSPNGFSVKDFREFIRTTYWLERERAMRIRKGDDNKPRLMIISRTKSRKLLNEGKISKMAQRLGYEVVVADATLSTNVSTFAHAVNSCDVLMGVHGAGLTNMVFLPDNAVVIQVVPLGGIEGFANADFGEPSKDMNLRYLSYKIRVKESSLIKQYPLDHQVIQDPFSLHKQGWDAIRTTYLDNQNVMLDVHRFRSTLLKALKLLHH